MKTYIAPSLVIRGNAVTETHASSINSAETAGQPNRLVQSLIGGVGFFL